MALVLSDPNDSFLLTFVISTLLAVPESQCVLRLGLLPFIRLAKLGVQSPKLESYQWLLIIAMSMKLAQ